MGENRSLFGVYMIWVGCIEILRGVLGMKFEVIIDSASRGVFRFAAGMSAIEVLLHFLWLLLYRSSRRF